MRLEVKYMVENTKFKITVWETNKEIKKEEVELEVHPIGEER